MGACQSKSTPLEAPVPVPDTALPPVPPPPAKEGCRELWDAVYNEQVDQVQALCERWGGNGEVISWANPEFDGVTPLHKANPLCAAVLVSTPGCDVNKADKDGWTPLWGAACDGNLEKFQVLLAAPGIDLNKAPTAGWGSGRSPLNIARGMAEGGRGQCKEVASLLEAAGAK